ncbi:endothelial lipase isoform X2 [Pteronotus mesoamericanus]|uniref:endothelial lipase isoform X2 n=1 Tax=Pteronotus mesoamericanus TaxID=1884717 RepID=UPI0023EBF720|nr:endothelial lipase isoform X2 [Pteronotus parnellii mesoamericanus]
MRNSVLLLCFWSVYCCLAVGGPATLGPEGPLQDELHKSEDAQATDKPSVRFNLRISKDPEHEGCYLSFGHNQTLEDCGFNMTAKTFFIIHGWTMSGMFEKWLFKLVSALQTREKEANVVVVDWLPLAHQIYTDAVKNIRLVGRSIARLLDQLQEKDSFSLGNVHLIGYSLGAHVAGYAGNFVKGTVGRITGLDPAGPMFEKADIHSRLSPDDADFVDVLHTYTRSFGLSIGIQRPVGHIDIYPNGGDFQPGCGLNDVLGSIAYGMYHYQMKIHVFSYKNTTEIEPNFYVTLYGIRADSQMLPLEIVEQIGLNATNTFLVYTEEDLGDLLKIRLTWKRASQSWYSLWNEFRSFLSQPRKSKPELNIRRIRVKSGETQQKFTFCAEDPENTSISPGQELWFHKCLDRWRVINETRQTVELL